MYKLCFYVPAIALETVKQACFDAGAGRIGDYDSCCWQAAGYGQFRPLDGSSPFIGKQGVVEEVEEYKVEMVCDDQFITGVVAAMCDAHPYEEPAYDVWRLEEL